MTLLRLLAALLCLSAAGLAVAEPYRPDDDRLVLLRVTPREAPQFAELWVARAAMRASPGNLERALDFARRAIDVGRRHGDPRFMSYAEAALARWQGPETPLEVRVIRATLAQNRHAFEAALKELESQPAALAYQTCKATHTGFSQSHSAATEASGLMACVDAYLTQASTAHTQRYTQILQAELQHAEAPYPSSSAFPSPVALRRRLP